MLAVVLRFDEVGAVTIAGALDVMEVMIVRESRGIPFFFVRRMDADMAF